MRHCSEMTEVMNTVENAISGNMTKKQMYQYEYVRTPEAMERARKESLRKSKERKVLTTMSRFEEHTVDELMAIVAAKCMQKGLDYELLKDDFSRLIRVLHDPV